MLTTTFPRPTASTARPATLHSRIREELRARIFSGAWQPHDRVPSESELMAQYGVSRVTVRQALGDLEKERLIFKIAGKGSFVAEPKPFQELGRLQGFAEAMGTHGHEIYNKLVHVVQIEATPKVAERLGLAPHTTVTKLQRVRYLDRRPVSLDVTWVPSHIGDRLAREDLATRDIFAIIENDYGTPLGHADLAIDATLADARLASLLEVPNGAPVLRVERLTHSKSGQPLDYEHHYFRADNFQYRLRVQRG
jgi:GntR family transcriptional regulator